MASQVRRSENSDSKMENYDQGIDAVFSLPMKPKQKVKGGLIWIIARHDSDLFDGQYTFVGRERTFHMEHMQSLVLFVLEYRKLFAPWQSRLMETHQVKKH